MRKVLIVGYGISGKNAAKLLEQDQYEVYVLDDQSKEEIPYKRISYRELKKKLLIFDLAIRSPGIKATSSLYKMIKIFAKEVISEIELGFRYLQKKNVKFVAVTGTNGKTTLVNLIYELVKSNYNYTYLRGNVGVPLTYDIKKIPINSIVIVEVSSFQLEDIVHFHPQISVFTNLAPNHLDHVISYGFYKASKKRMLINLNRHNYVFYSNESLELIDANILAKKINIDCDATRVTIKDDEIHVDGRKTISLKSFKLKGDHNIRHLKTALNVAFTLFPYFKLNPNILNNFAGIQYRMEELGEYGRYKVINDGKSTNVAATIATLETYKDLPRTLILGGIDKSGTFNKIVLNHDDEVFTYGKHGQDIILQMKCGKYFPTLLEIIQYLSKQKSHGYLIFSPGCSSFDQFDNYIKRSEYFAKIVEELKNV